MKLMIATSITDCKDYCIEEFLQRLEMEMQVIDTKLEDWHVLVYGDRLAKDGYVYQILLTWLKKHKERVTYMPGKDIVIPEKDNVFNSRIVGQIREAMREVALGSDWWDTLLFWDADVFPDANAIIKLAEVMEKQDADLIAGCVADWSSGVLSIASFTEDMQLVWKTLKTNTSCTVGATHLAFTMIKRKVLEEEGFASDERIDAYGEDGFFCQQLYKKGCKIMVTTDVLSLHVHESGKVSECVNNKGSIAVRKYQAEMRTVAHAGKEEAVLYIRDDAGGHFPAPIDWTFRRGEPVPVRELGEKKVKKLLEGTAFKKTKIAREELQIATNLFSKEVE